jgi:CRISPR/Cas system-associated exonuclease Cas4 (RecB family)
MPIVIRPDSEFTNMLKSNLRSRYNDRKKDRIGLAPIHVSDILPSSCIRKQYYSRVYPDEDPITDESIHHFVRGESSEFAITHLAKIGVAQAELQMDEIVAHPDIMDNTDGRMVIIELKDTVAGKRLDINDYSFRSYLRQLLYYLIMTGIEKGIISIRYNIKELRLIKKDDTGEYYFRPKDTRPPGIESWSVNLPKDDIMRELLRNEMVLRKNMLVSALETHDVTILPRVTEPLKSSKCPSCPFYSRCYDEMENERALDIAQQTDILDIRGTVDFRPFQ